MSSRKSVKEYYICFWLLFIGEACVVIALAAVDWRAGLGLHGVAVMGFGWHLFRAMVAEEVAEEERTFR
jgi:hypothetical protein